jgi:hypothetical protein
MAGEQHRVGEEQGGAGIQRAGDAFGRVGVLTVSEELIRKYVVICI